MLHLLYGLGLIALAVLIAIYAIFALLLRYSLRCTIMEALGWPILMIHQCFFDKEDEA